MTQPQYDPQASGPSQGVPSQPYGQPNPYGQPAPYGQGPSSGDPLTQPLYGASFGQAIGRFFKKYAQFNGRASRSEFLWATLFNVIVVAVLYVIAIAIVAATAGSASDPSQVSSGAGAGLGIIGLIIGLYGLAIIVPSIALQVRRLHDTGQSGFLVLLNLIPSIGGLIVFIMCCLPTSPNGDRYNV
ncbi:DUF805 domain-containing protein [Desertihabitans brevis]|uniref:DUF805 domain-containing protein n=1 Tax=Desertihabitans brevis TaxID=2268447 RepID=A0A367YXJ9_9ACTN|nr:DUF805 domain-containing protein [Desertihabitans brevis]RCK70249.1 DUF805 domain-containing protein [Desertihabitans brevis]